MARQLFNYFVLVLTLIAVLPAAADVVTDWNDTALDAIRLHNTPPPAAARNLAILHVAVYDAVNGILRTHEPYLVTEDAPFGASVEVAAATAARDVLSALYPGAAATFDALHATIVNSIVDGVHKTSGIAWGAGVAARILAERQNDGSAAVAEWPGADEPGRWRPTESFGGAVLPALLPGWGQVTPFALASGSQFRPPAPPALHTGRYAIELNQVKSLGAVNSTQRTVDQSEIALFWGYGPRTPTPPGHWNEIAQAVASSEGNSLAQNARMFALLNIALADAAIVSWDCKYEFDYWRPITAIALADTDGNRLTAPDITWRPLLPTPPFPEYTSGHSTFSGAAAVTLALFYGRDRIAFTVGSDDLPGVFRSYDGFWEAAVESGMSRIYGGIHFMSANRDGLLTGARTARYVFQRYLRPVAYGAK
jgi:membrane-associated phospholipid phosphatase